MVHLSVNWLAIVVATAASMILGIAWYMGLSRQWMAAVGKTPEALQSAGPSPYLWSVLVQLVMAYFLAVMIAPLTGEVSVISGMAAGAQLWLGFVITAMILNHRYQGAPWALTLIDGGYMLGVLVLQGAVIGAFG
ncbi:DUF1761 domain-containing protein [Arsenicitalea aurantiaca]|uniref:DUF1761 domain-containing protein n=1 Tax=Arsenicitalea aurantiaca TaxID=1783274 RepID=A0A433X5L6_9HYPH|nr:DUF1761 domain-containing protein [Arsenicitalea aurantiaca]RUT29344.1 DUF1761 domain-containing protein [Arsenicitalea aurantiaca]